MRVIRSTAQMAALARRFEQEGRRIGVVPTMGALHEGHLSLIRRAAFQNDVAIVTIFVNPLQFAPREDFARYPRNLSRDVRLSRGAGASVVFAPGPGQIYPRGFQTFVSIEDLSREWEGEARPGHFRGVATVVGLLFHLTRPSRAYFGQKDYQQALIIRQMVRDLRWPLTVHVLPTVREPDGLAMSSRNRYLTSRQRAQARCLYQALKAIRQRVRRGERRAKPLLQTAARLVRQAGPGLRLDYAAIADAHTLRRQSRLRGRVVILLAVWVGRTRLIDNLLVDVS